MNLPEGITPVVGLCLFVGVVEINVQHGFVVIIGSDFGRQKQFDPLDLEGDRSFFDRNSRFVRGTTGFDRQNHGDGVERDADGGDRNRFPFIHRLVGPTGQIRRPNLQFLLDLSTVLGLSGHRDFDFFSMQSGEFIRQFQGIDVRPDVLSVDHRQLVTDLQSCDFGGRTLLHCHDWPGVHRQPQCTEIVVLDDDRGRFSIFADDADLDRSIGLFGQGLSHFPECANGIPVNGIDHIPAFKWRLRQPGDATCGDKGQLASRIGQDLQISRIQHANLRSRTGFFRQNFQLKRSTVAMFSFDLQRRRTQGDAHSHVFECAGAASVDFFDLIIRLQASLPGGHPGPNFADD